MSLARSRMKAFLGRHLFAYVAILALLVVVVASILGRGSLRDAWSGFDTRYVLPVLALSLGNYLLRFLKWHLLLLALGERVPLWSNLRIYFACLSMVVTPFRLGELYKVVLLRRLHGLPLQKSAPALLVDRFTDGLAVMALATLGFSSDQSNMLPRMVLLVILTLAASLLMGRPGFQSFCVGILRRIPWTRARADDLAGALASSAHLFSVRNLAPALILSVAAWFAECVGLYLILVGLGVPIALIDATRIYAASTIAGNLTLLPGGLVGTEAVMVGMLRQVGVAVQPAAAATLLIRGATLWFAVILGVVTTWTSRGRLDWDAVREEASHYS